jgi:hypothetical protein
MVEGYKSSPEVKTSVVWTRLIVPSAGDLIFLALLGMLVATPLSLRLLADGGTGWHIRTGQQILATRAIPHVDFFSSTMQGKPWFAWEWLYDVAAGAAERWARLNGVVLLTALLIASVFAWSFQLLLKHGTNVLIALVLLLLAASASMIHFQARPHVVSWLLTLVWFQILDSSEARCWAGRSSGLSERWLWLLPPLMLLWVNMHGGFLLGFALLAIYLGSAAWIWIRLKDDRLDEFLLRLRSARRAKTLAVVGVLTAAATLANPYGWRLHAHIYGYLTNRFFMDHIDEFQSPNFHGIAQKCFAALMLVAFVAVAAKARKVRPSEGLILIFAVYSGLYASRNIPVSSLLLVLVSGPLLTQTLHDLAAQSSAWLILRRICTRLAEFSGRMETIESSLRLHLWALAGILLACGIAANGGRFGSKVVMDAHFDGKRFPVQAVDYLTKHTGVPVLAPDYWGGYLIYRLYPETLVVADDRHDLYGADFFKDYLKAIRAEPEWDGFLRKYAVRRILVPKQSPLDNLLQETSTWKIIYADDQAVLWEIEN